MSKIYSVFDRRLKEHLFVVVGETDEAMLRQIFNDFLSRETIFSRFPADYDLIFVSEFNRDTGVVLPVDPVIVSSFNDILDKFTPPSV